MNDFEYDSYCKKNIANSASRRRGGSKSRKCPLSTDHMTHKQWKERNGEVMHYQLGSPMVWAEFNKLPSDLKEEYMNNLIRKYSANARGMADMFGVSVATVFRVVKNEKLNVEFLKGRHPAGNKKVEFERFLRGEQTEDVVEEVSVVEPVVANEDVPAQSAVSVPGSKLDSFTMNFSGPVDVNMIANSLRYILGSGGNAKIQIVCEMI